MLLINAKGGIEEATLEAFEHNSRQSVRTGHRVRLRRLKTYCLLAEGNQGEEARFSQKTGSNFQVADKSLAAELKTRGIYWPISIPTCPTHTRASAKNPKNQTGGERGIRTLDTLLEYARFPGVCLQPLGHLSRRKQKPCPTARRGTIFFRLPKNAQNPRPGSRW